MLRAWADQQQYPKARLHAQLIVWYNARSYLRKMVFQRRRNLEYVYTLTNLPKPVIT